MNKKLTVLLAAGLVLCAVVALVGGYLIWNVLLHHQSGSATPHAAVYRFELDGFPAWRYVLKNDEGVFYRSGICFEPVYIYEENGKLLVLEEAGSQTAVSFDMATGEEKTKTVFDWRNPFAKTEHLITKPVYAGKSHCASAWDISAGDGGMWYWKVDDTQGDEIWDGTSETFPEFAGNDAFLTVYYTEEGQEFCYEFSPEESWRSYDYALYENRTVYVEQLTDVFAMYDLELPQSTGTMDFVNTEPTELTDCNSAYFRAKAEVSIPYDLVTFRFEVHGYDIAYWEVTFSQKDDTEGAVQTVYMTGDGVTIYVLDGRGTDL